MNTTELNGTEYTLTEGEGGKITLTPIREIIEQRTPEAGDVWEDKYEWGGEAYLVGDEESICLDGEDDPGGCSVNPFDFKGCTYLGKFNEVYVKIADVRAALSHKDRQGEDMLDYFDQELNSRVQNYGAGESFKALRKLNIITD